MNHTLTEPPRPSASLARTILTAIVTFVLVVTGAVIAPAATAAGPTLSVDALPREGGTVSVSGAAFSTVSPGLYVGLRAQGASSDTFTVWIDTVNVAGELPGLGATAPMNADGSFRVDVVVPAFAEGVSYTIVARKAHGIPDPSQTVTIDAPWAAVPEPEPTTPVPTPTPTETVPAHPTPEPTAPAPVYEPALEVFLADGVTPYAGQPVYSGDELVVRGSGFDPAANVGGRGVPIPNTLPQGTYVVFGSFLEQWQPSAGAASASRKAFGQKWVLAESVLDQVPSRYQAAVRGQWAALSDEGTFEARLAASDFAAGLEGGRWGVYSYGAGGVSNAAQELAVPIDYRGDRPVYEPEVSAEVTSAATSGLGIQLDVSGLDPAVAGAYVAIIAKDGEADITPQTGVAAMAFVRQITDGTFTQALTAAADTLDRATEYEVIVWKQHTLPNAETILARSALSVTPAQWDAVFGTTTPTPPTTPTTPTVPTTGGSLSWAISSSFASYVTGPIAHGSIAVSDGATRSGGRFQFGQAAGTTFDPATGLGSVDYVGRVSFSGHGGVLAVTISNPQVRVTSATTAEVYVTSGGQRIHFANLNLAGGVRLAAGGAVSYSEVPASLTPAGQNDVLEGFATSLDPISFTIGAPSNAPAGATGTIAQAPAAERTAIPATPPATTGIDAAPAEAAALAAGRAATVTARGFAPGETGIRVVVYSTPVLLGTVDADAAGIVRWTGAVPASLADGEHTLTFQGSVDRGIVFTLARAAAVGTCAVTGATFQWGFKESFLTYIEGIAAGGWELSGVTYAYPDFVWAAGAGSVDPEQKTGLIDVGGQIAFSGHGGALQTTLSAARLELVGEVGYVVFDVTGTTQDGTAVSAAGVRFASFATGDLAVVDGALVLDALPTTLTDAGAAAFGTYPAGEAFAPLTASLPVAADCGGAPEKEEAVVAAPVAEETAAPVSESAPVWPWVLGGGALLAAALVAVLLAQRARRRAAQDATP